MHPSPLGSQAEVLTGSHALSEGDLKGALTRYLLSSKAPRQWDFSRKQKDKVSRASLSRSWLWPSQRRAGSVPGFSRAACGLEHVLREPAAHGCAGHRQPRVTHLANPSNPVLNRESSQWDYSTVS